MEDVLMQDKKDKLEELCENLTLLYVEDDDMIRETYTDLFYDYFGEVLTAENGKIGLDTYKENMNKIDIIITDINMPIMDGRTMIKNIFEIKLNQKIVVMSAHDTSEDLISFMKLGVNDFLSKPIKIEYFIDSLTTIAEEINDSKETSSQKIIKKTDDLFENEVHLENDLLKTLISVKIKNIDEVKEKTSNTNIDFHKKVESILNTIENNNQFENLELFEKSKNDLNLLFLIQSTEEISIADISGFVNNINNYINREFDFIISGNFEVISNFNIVRNEKQHLLQKLILTEKYAEKNSQIINYYNKEYNLFLNDSKYSTIEWIDIIKTALQQGKIYPYYQPIIENNTGEIEKYECLVRLENPYNPEEIFSPFYFLDIAIEYGLYSDITKSVIKNAFREMKDKHYNFSINLMPQDIENPEITNLIIQQLEETQIRGRVVFEILETEKVEKEEAIFNLMKKVQNYDCKLAIDDFGTGYSNFNYILRLNANFIKIDGSIIKNILTDKKAETVVETIVLMAKKLDLQTIAEYVSSKEIYEKVKALGVDFSQGYYLGEPLNKIK